MKKLLAFILAMAMLLSLAACGNNSTPGAETSGNPAADGTQSPAESSAPAESPSPAEHEYTTIKVGVYSGTLVGTTDPYARNVMADTYGLRALVYDCLFYPDPNTGEMVSNIIESYSWSDDYLEFTMKLKDGIYFSNGEQMIGEDVIYSIKNYQQGFGFGYYQAINCDASYVDEDNLTVHLIYDFQYGPGIKKLDCFIGDKSFLESIGEDADFYDISNAVGSGPYAITNLENEASATFELRDDYWGTETYPVDKYECYVYTDQSTMAVDLENDVIDLAINASESDTSRLMDAGSKYTVDVIGSGSIVMLGLSDESEALQDPRVREAICHAVDTAALTEATYGVLGSVATGYFAESMDGYMYTAYDYDPELSKQLLTEAGVSDLHLFFATRSNGVYPAISDILQAYLNDVGITLDIEVNDFVTLRTTTYQEPGGTDFQCITNADGSPEGEGYFCLSTYETGNIYTALNKSDEAFNASMDKIRNNVDPAIRAEGFEEVQTWLYENYWVIPLSEWGFSVLYNSDAISNTNLDSYMKCNLRFLELAQ